MKLQLLLFFILFLGIAQLTVASSYQKQLQATPILPTSKQIVGGINPSAENPMFGATLIKHTIERAFSKMGVLKPQSAGKLLIGLLLLLLGAAVVSISASSNSSGAVLFGTILALVGAGMLGYDLLPFFQYLDGNS